ncbi:MAG: radical SAM protein [Thermodesulfobacteriota bacterium]|jgi:radical SAM superfamily enzyme YgiQ (UPF0313 family)|tara:strand:- start:578 stop:1468 length:891 start_codon:yes stop_codon:yes gene_type:complete
MINFEQPMFRPPSEANSLLIQATIGCSHNNCTYCAMYRQSNQKFRMRSEKEIFQIIDENSDSSYKKAFIADGNALVLPTKLLTKTIDKIYKCNPNINRVSIYGNVGDILRKKPSELEDLAVAGLDMVYIGFESGDDITLKRIKKGANKIKTIDAMKKLKKAGIKVSGMVLLGVGGKERSFVHAYETADMLSQGDPDYVGLLSLQVRPGAPIYEAWEKGNFELPDKFQILKELEIIAENTVLTNGHFFSNHISNYLPIKAIYPGDKEKTVKKIKDILSKKSESELRSEYYRDIVNQY